MNNTDLKSAYRNLLVVMLREHNVKSVTCTDKKEPFFDKIEVNADGTLTVTDYGNLTFDNLYFDFTCDYARCFSYIEDAIFLQSRNGKPEHGMSVEFYE